MNVWNPIKGIQVSHFIIKSRILWVVASVALFAFVSLAECLAAYLFGQRKINTNRPVTLLSDERIDQVNIPFEVKKEKGVSLFDSMRIPTNIEHKKKDHHLNLPHNLDNALPQENDINSRVNPLEPVKISEVEILRKNANDLQNIADSLIFISNMSENDDIDINLEDKQTPEWMNDHPDISFNVIGLTSYEEIIDFLGQKGSHFKSINLGTNDWTDDQFEAFIKLCPNIHQVFVSSSKISDKALESLKEKRRFNCRQSINRVIFFNCLDFNKNFILDNDINKKRLFNCYSLVYRLYRFLSLYAQSS